MALGILGALYEDLLLLRHDRALEHVAQEPELPHRSIHAAAAWGLSAEVSRFLAIDPKLATEVDTRFGMSPIVYLCHSPIQADEPQAPELLRCLHLLLDSGANPNERFRPLTRSELTSILFVVSGIRRDPALTATLLRRGADPSDGNSLLPACSHHDATILDLLLEAGAQPGRRELEHVIDHRNREGLAKLLRHAPGLLDSDRELAQGLLVRGLFRSCEPALLRLLVEAGAKPEQAIPGSELTPAALAAVLEEEPAEELFATMGADRSLTGHAAFLAACHRGDQALVSQMLRKNARLAAQTREAPFAWFIELAARGNRAAVETMLRFGSDPDSADSDGARALHHAAWWGHDGVVRTLIDNGASVELRDLRHSGTPLCWSVHGAAHAPPPRGAHGLVVDLLLAADCPIAASERRWLLETAPPELRRALRAAF